MTPRRWAWLLVVAVVVYFLLAGTRGWALLTSGDTAGVFLGAAVLVLPVIGAWVVWREVAFGYAMQAMGADLAACGDLPVACCPRKGNASWPLSGPGSRRIHTIGAVGIASGSPRMLPVTVDGPERLCEKPCVCARHRRPKSRTPEE